MARKTILRALPIAALFAAGTLGLAAPAAADAGIQVKMNQAKIVKLARPADTIVVGNPAIADAAVQDASTIVLTGKGFGVTNLVILDGDGNPIVDEQVTVVRQAAQFRAHLPPRRRPDAFLHALLRELLQERSRADLRSRDDRQPVDTLVIWLRV